MTFWSTMLMPLIYVKTICTQQKHGKLKIKTAPSVNSQTEFDYHDCPTQGGTPFWLTIN